MTTTTDTRTPAERAYDALKDGSAYIAQHPDELDDDGPSPESLITPELTAAWQTLYAGQTVPDLREALADIDSPDRETMPAYIQEDAAHRLNGDLFSIGVAPGIESWGGNTPSRLCYVPKVTASSDGRLFVKLGGENRSDGEEVIYNPPQLIHEVLRVRRFGLVILVADDEVFVMSEAEYTAQIPVARPAPAYETDRTSFPYRVGAAAGTLTHLLLHQMERGRAEETLTLLNDLAELLDDDLADVPGLAV